MLPRLTEKLRCPISKSPLRIEVIREGSRKYGDLVLQEVEEGILFSEEGFVFPVIDGIPRLLVESVLVYEAFLKEHIPGFNEVKRRLLAQHGKLIQHCYLKNKATRKSFGFEWNLLSYEQNDRIWHTDVDALGNVFLQETGKSDNPGFYHGKTVLDVGCGHGLMAQKIAALSGEVMAVELSPAVIQAYQQNTCSNLHFVQADLSFLPFDDQSFDILYSSGVLHHTPDTKKSLFEIETVLKPEGLICIWLYHPQNKLLHNLMMKLRLITARVPLPVSTVLIMLFIFPFSFLLKQLKRKNPPNYREEMIDLLDALTPAYRHEITHEKAAAWLKEKNYHEITITTSDQFGFSITGVKPKN